MSTDEFQKLWKAYDAKLEKTLQMNQRLFSDLQQQKAKSVLRGLVATRVFGIVIGGMYLALLVVALRYVWSQPVMAVSIGVFIGCTMLAMVAYIRDIVVVRGLSYVDSVLAAQEKLASLRSSIIGILRFSWIQLPFWATFFVSNALLRNGGPLFLKIEIPIVLFLVAVAIFLFRNITVANAQKKRWVAGMIRGSGAKSVSRAIELLKEIEDFKKEA
jgi:hypothetical protein